MLDPWIIEEIIRREREEQERRQQQRIELPLQRPDHDSIVPSSKPAPHEDKDRGVTVIDI
jgi:hypothetical protein